MQISKTVNNDVSKDPPIEVHFPVQYLTTLVHFLLLDLLLEQEFQALAHVVTYFVICHSLRDICIINTNRKKLILYAILITDAFGLPYSRILNYSVFPDRIKNSPLNQ